MRHRAALLGVAAVVVLAVGLHRDAEVLIGGAGVVGVAAIWLAWRAPDTR